MQAINHSRECLEKGNQTNCLVCVPLNRNRIKNYTLAKISLKTDQIINELEYVMKYQYGENVISLQLGIANALTMLKQMKQEASR